MSFIQPITDRTILDIDKLQEYDEIGYKNLTTEQKNEWLSGMKGALNSSDLNRIESNQQYIFTLLSNQYILTFKTNWLMTDFVSKIKYYEFQTDNGEDFLVDDENFIVNDNILRDGFLTNQDEPFITSDDEDLNVFTQQI